MILIAWCPNFFCLLVAQLISAIGFGIKGIAESNFLNCSLPKSSKKGKIFSKIDGGGYSKFCYVGATSVLISGFLYDINPYIPIGLCLFFNILAMIFAMNFIDIEKIEEKSKDKEDKKTIKQEVSSICKDLNVGFKFILKSSRLRTLLLMLGIGWGLISVFATYQETVLKEMQIPSYYIGIILASFQLLVGISATKSIEFNKKFGNKSLTIINLGITLGSIIIGFVLLLPLPFSMQLMIVIMVFIVRAYMKGIYQVNKKRYMGNFADKKILPKIYSINGMIANLGRMIIGFIGTSILKVTNIANATIIMGIVTTVGAIILYFYSKNKVGLKPEEYKKAEIDFNLAMQEK